MTGIKTALAIMAAAALTLSVRAGDTMFEAYADGDYYTAGRLARARLPEPEARLISALSRLYEPSASHAEEGLRDLYELCGEKVLSPELQLQGQLSLARCAQLMQQRDDLYGQRADYVNWHGIYDEIIRNHPNDPAACDALLYLEAQPEVTLPFAAAYQGDRRDLTAIYMYAATLYIERGEFIPAARALETAYNIGIGNPIFSQLALFRIGYLYDRRGGDYQSAEKYYREFIERYPRNKLAQIAARYIDEHEAAERTKSK